MIPEAISVFLDQAEQWCKGKLWQVRLPLLFLFGYLLLRHILTPGYSSILSLLNLGIHELGHLIFALFGTFIGISGGTLLQCFVPLFAMFNFYRQDDFFSIALSFGWLSTSLFDVANYVADARRMDLPLVSPFGAGENTIHDWNYILSKLGILKFDLVLAWILKIIATFSMLICLIFGAWLLWRMFKSPGEIEV